MFNRILDFFKGPSRLKALQKENQELKTELHRRQEAINKTNAYWKSVIRKMNKAA